MPIVQELIEKLKRQEHLTSNYQVAKYTQIPENRINDYVKGRVRPDAYAATRLALALEREPIEVIAEIEAETETNETKRKFWRDFLSHAVCIGVSATVLLYGSLRNDAHAADNLTAKQLSEHQIMRTVQFLRELWQRLNARKKRTPSSGAMLCLQR